VSGYLVEQNYREGSSVAKHQILFQVDRPADASAKHIHDGKPVRSADVFGRWCELWAVGLGLCEDIVSPVFYEV
jgi:hypothetical protein